MGRPAEKATRTSGGRGGGGAREPLEPGRREGGARREAPRVRSEHRQNLFDERSRVDRLDHVSPKPMGERPFAVGRPRVGRQRDRRHVWMQRQELRQQRVAVLAWQTQISDQRVRADAAACFDRFLDRRRGDDAPASAFENGGNELPSSE